MTSHVFGLQLIYSNIYVSRVWEWVIELHLNLPAATAAKSGCMVRK